MAEVAEIFNNFYDYLSAEQDLREKIRAIVRKIERSAREIAMILQNIHNREPVEENIIVSRYCAKAREHFEDVRRLYGELANIIPKNQYYRFNDHWRNVTQRLCFSASLIIYLEIKELPTRETIAEFLGLQRTRAEGFHLDLEDFLMGLLDLASELTRFAINSVTTGYFDRPLEISRFINELNAGFRVLNFKNDNLRKRFDGLKYDVKKVEEIVYDLSIRGLKGTETDEATGNESAEQTEKVEQAQQAEQCEQSERCEEREQSEQVEEAKKTEQPK